MNQDIANTIKQLVDERIALLQFNTQAPRDYPAIRECMLQLELQQEISALKEMLNDLPSFENEFKKRCAQRERGNEQTFSLHDMPESICNQLYWQIAELVFQPNTMSDMLAILLPSTRLYLKADLQYVQKNLPNAHYRTTRPEPILVNYDKHDDKPLIENVKHYVLTDNTLFDTKTIASFSLTAHINVQVLLNTKYPNIAQKLYEHNEDMSRLSKDILTLNNEGIAPKSAIEQLIKGLILGGEKMTGQGIAGQCANNALTQFFKYFNELPNRLKNQLRALEGVDHTLGGVIDNELEKGKCVETAATHLTAICQQNKHEPIITASPAMSQMDLKELKNKYHHKHLDTQKDSLLTPIFPSQLSRKVIERIATETTEELISLILNFPTNLYETLWQNITIKNPHLFFYNFANLIKQGYLNQAQKLAVAKAIASQYPRFQLQTSFLFWAAQCADISFFLEAFNLNGKKDPLEKLTAPSPIQNDPTLLQFITLRQPAFIKTILTLLPEQDRFTALTTENKKDRYDIYNDSPLSLAYNQPKLLTVMLSLLLPQDRLKALTQKNRCGDTLLHLVTDECLEAILPLVPEQDLLKAVAARYRQITFYTPYTLLHKAIKNPNLLKMVFSLLPTKDHFSAMTIKNEYNETLFEVAGRRALQVIRELVNEEILALIKLILFMNKLIDIYIRHHSDCYYKGYQRGYTYGFFSSFRHGDTGINRAKAFKDNLQQITSSEEVIELIDNILTGSAATYHTHSLTSYLMDGINIFLIKKNINKNELISLPNKQRHYSVDSWFQVKDNVMDSLGLLHNNRPQQYLLTSLEL